MRDLFTYLQDSWLVLLLSDKSPQ